MSYRIILTICLLLASLLLVSPTFSSEKKGTQVVNLTLVQIIKIPWGMPLKEIENQYPGGYINPNIGSVVNIPEYELTVFLENLERQASLRLYYLPISYGEPKTNFVTKAYRLIKELTISYDNSDFPTVILKDIQEILKQNFPNGIPVVRIIKQTGYLEETGFVIPSDDFSEIRLSWSFSRKDDVIRLFIEEK